MTDRLPAVAIDPPQPPTRSRWCIALAALFLVAAVLDVTLWLRAIDAEVQLRTCRHEMGCLQRTEACH